MKLNILSCIFLYFGCLVSGFLENLHDVIDR